MVNRVVEPLPGMDCAFVGGDTRHFDAFRLGPNDWGVVGSSLFDAAAIRDSAARTFLPSAALAALGPDAAAFFARLELDKCGAWITLATAGHPRPIVVRRAGWIDVRGHVHGRDDRVGLGPADALVVFTDALASAANAAGEPFADELLADALLDCAGAPARSLAEHVLQAATAHAGSLRDDAAVLIARVPEEGDRDPLLRLVEATGIAAEDLQLPGYPLGDEQPDLWAQRPDPPREARIRLAPIPASVPRIRELLRRLLRSWRMPDCGEGVVELLATELAANVVMHAQSDMTVIVRYLGRVVRVEVGDGSPEQPQPRRAADDDLGGRGLALVEALSDDWGVLPTRTGKRVWCDVAVSNDTGSGRATDG